MPLIEALAKCTSLPAKLIYYCTPQMARKGRLREGCDADIVAFDFARLTDHASFEAMNRPSEGVVPLLVGAQAVIPGGRLDPREHHGRPNSPPLIIAFRRAPPEHTS